MKKSKPIYILRKTDWSSTEILKAFQSREIAQKQCDAMNAQAKSSYGNLYSVERVNYLYEE